jgi:hypothetical protein
MVDLIVSGEVKSRLVTTEGTAGELTHGAHHDRAGRAVHHVFSLVLLEEAGQARGRPLA